MMLFKTKPRKKNVVYPFIFVLHYYKTYGCKNTRIYKHLMNYYNHVQCNSKASFMWASGQTGEGTGR